MVLFQVYQGESGIGVDGRLKPDEVDSAVATVTNARRRGKQMNDSNKEFASSTVN